MKKRKIKSKSKSGNKNYIFKDDDLIPFSNAEPDIEEQEVFRMVLGARALQKIEINKTNLFNNGKING